MLLDPMLLVKNWPLILALGIVAILVRSLAVSGALLITGTADRDAIRAGLMVTPIGEFAFIIAQIGVSSGILSADYYPIAVGVSLLTALISPALIQHSGQISDYALRCEPKFFHDLVKLYQQFLASAGEHQRRSRVAGLAKRSLPPLVISVTFVSGILIAAPLLYSRWSWLFAHSARSWPYHLFWALLGVAVAGPLLWGWRRFSEFLKQLVEIAFGGGLNAQHPGLVICLEIMTAFLLLVWVWLLTPGIGLTAAFFGSIIATSALYAFLFGQGLKTVQSRIASELSEAILSSEERRKRLHDNWLKDHQEWDLSLSEIRVPDSEAWFGKSLGDLSLRSQFGCSIVGVERQGYPVPSSGPDTELYPNDILLVLGTEQQIQRVRAFFDSTPNKTEKANLLDEIRLESIEVPETGRLARNALAELEIPRHTGIQVAGVARGDFRILFPGPFQVLLPGDWLLVVGTRDQIHRFREWMTESD
jgi:monovalent cation:H+ antiporter-2, CPA2 family